MNVTLIVFKSDGSRKDIPVAPGRYVVGRKPDASIRVPVASVSREHCEIILDQSGLRVRDLGSSNGTFKNHERVKESALTPGDVLTVGPVSLTVQIDGKPANVARPKPGMNDDDDSAFDLPSSVKPMPAVAPLAKPAAAAPAPAAHADPDDSSLGETLKKPNMSPLVGKSGSDDSSVFDFDFDFEDDDRPRL